MSRTHSSNEAERLLELSNYAILDTPPEAAFDELTSLAAYICGAPISLVSLVDKERMWFKSKVGISVSEIPRIDGFCSSAICDETILVVPDAAANPRLANHPLVTSQPNLRFYAGAPLTTPRGYRLGTLCVIDTVPRNMSAEQIEALKSLARTVITQLELRRLVRDTTENLTGQLFKAQDDERRRIARELHDSTGQVLAGVSMMIGQMQKESSPADAAKFADCREMIAKATSEIRNLSYLLHPPLLEELGLASAVAEYATGFARRSGIDIQLEISPEVGRLSENVEITFFRIIQEALGNIHRHSGSAVAVIRIYCLENNVILEIQDHGRGLPARNGQSHQLGVGIKSMQERVRLLGGLLHITSSTSGVLVKTVLPRKLSINPEAVAPGESQVRGAATIDR
jgi:signal transduction histidine kinase